MTLQYKPIYLLKISHIQPHAVGLLWVNIKHKMELGMLKRFFFNETSNHFVETGCLSVIGIRNSMYHMAASPQQAAGKVKRGHVISEQSNALLTDLSRLVANRYSCMLLNSFHPWMQ